MADFIWGSSEQIPNRSLSNAGLSTSGGVPIFKEDQVNRSFPTSVVQSPPSKMSSGQLPDNSAFLNSDSTGTIASSETSFDASKSFSNNLNSQRSTENLNNQATFVGVDPHDPNNQNIGTYKNTGFATTSANKDPDATFFNFKNENADPFDRVKLRFKQGHPMSQYPGMLRPLAQTNGMVFPFRPSLSISSGINYDNISLTHSIQDLKCFSGNTAPTINIQGTFTSKTVDEAMYTLAAIHFLRCASKMSFGSGSQMINGIPLGTPNGSPPPVLVLSGYGVGMINDLPVILTGTVPFELPSDVDYVEIPTGIAAGTKVPTIYNMNITLTVQRSVENMREFNLDYFTRYGIQGWF